MNAKDGEIRELQNRLNRLEIETAQLKAQWERDRQQMMHQLNIYAAAVEQHNIPLHEDSRGGFAEAMGFGGDVDTGAGSSLDSKMQQLNNLLNENQLGHSDGDPKPCNGEQTGSIANTLQAMFPHATIRTGKSELDPGSTQEQGSNLSVEERQIEPRHDPAMAREVDVLAANIQQVTGAFDQRAMNALQMLALEHQKEAMQRVQDMVNAQGGQCRNVSALLQSLCRKIEARKPSDRTQGEKTQKDASREIESPNWTPTLRDPNSYGDLRQDTRARRYDDERDAFNESAEELASAERLVENITGDEPQNHPDYGSSGETHSQPGTTPSNRKLWADIGDEEDGDESSIDPKVFQSSSYWQDPLAVQASDAYWTIDRLDRLARNGSFELKRREGKVWELRIWMAELKPPLLDTGMERYCQWLMGRLKRFRQDHGAEAIRRCRADVDFSRNGLGDEEVWKLLETLAQCEVHVAVLKLFGNRIAQGGVLAICEFLRKNLNAGPVWEMHLSHNEIDDDSALELVQTLHDSRKYPPQRPREGEPKGELVTLPVWIRLNNNAIKDPKQVLKRMCDVCGGDSAVCTATNRKECGPAKCERRRTSSLVHLYNFKIQGAHSGWDEGGSKRWEEAKRWDSGQKRWESGSNAGNLRDDPNDKNILVRRSKETHLRL